MAHFVLVNGPIQMSVSPPPFFSPANLNPWGRLGAAPRASRKRLPRGTVPVGDWESVHWTWSQSHVGVTWECTDSEACMMMQPYEGYSQALTDKKFLRAFPPLEQLIL